MFEFFIVFILVVFALTLCSGIASAFLHAKYGHIASVALIADAFAAVYLAGSSVIIGPLRALGRHDKLDEAATKQQLPPPDKPLKELF